MLFLSIGELMGRFHPALVHLPIGILMIACIFQWIAVREKFTGLKPAIPLMLLWGGICAFFSCITGYFLSQSADYNEELVFSHKWLGIITATASLGIYYLYQKRVAESIVKWMTVGLFGLITITGHIGGSLTHGEDYLTELWSFGTEKQVALAPIPQIQEVQLYKDVVNPILEARCYGCHGATKQKGKLRLDSKSGIEKGGEEGDVLVPGKPEESELIKRLLLSMDAKKHMPPKNKSQLTAEEIALLHWWVNKGADFSKKVKDIEQPESIKPVLLALQTGKTGVIVKKIPDVPETPVIAGNKDSIAALQKSGVSVIPVAQNSNYLSVNFISALVVNDTLIRLLEPLKDQLVWLKMDGVKLSDSAIAVLSKCTQLRRLQLNNTGLTDQQLTNLATLTNLQSINLVGTAVTPKGLLSLARLPHLKTIYIYKTSMAAGDWTILQQNLKGITLDTGNYLVPTLPTDTVIVTTPQ
ncbi:c-type cytochrome domain-containing protein [Flavihumibacter fluvii]|uniref:c-type cytochrome domain-containing protein n=1 Tax=Flavihumibacter fluvii TaxID=2838157 RepID=UPI001BDEE60F|nr:c-type cytochrome domain-containing protein [Flavihumibacter fluvii]ULQ54179.1 hypothetical protein KJS93_07595 [Flavihumibacter fluvii]